MSQGDRLSLEVGHDLSLVAELLIKESARSRVWIFDGCLGSGKTTMIKAVCEVLGVRDKVLSPSYSIVNEYIGLFGEIFYHFDFYRLGALKDAVDIGFDDYLYSGNYCFIEWPGLVYPLLPEDFFSVKIEIVKDSGVRILDFGHKTTKLKSVISRVDNSI
jgi:tRNA threonylcarbamoyladenosine biosynthesis protein TsaE